ncbi:MAG: hypothetical protein SV686_00425 [Thermodesulfobacteriota bacterium]|jgi:hypothetical protein|nr:hypothetical protein [Thermodesulfobacteriota bacterium]
MLNTYKTVPLSGLLVGPLETTRVVARKLLFLGVNKYNEGRIQGR